MKNLIVLQGRLPMFEGKYTPANGDKKSRMNWAMNVQLNTKNENGYYDEALMNFTAWGYYADQLQQISSLPKDDATRKAFSNIEVTGRLVAGYRDKDGNIQNQASIEVQEVVFVQRLPKVENGTDGAFAPASAPASVPAGRPAGVPGGVPGGAPAMGRPGMPGAPGVPAGVPGVPGGTQPRF